MNDQQAETVSITCPRCGAVSHHPEDIAQGYCIRCHWWTSDATLGRPEVLAWAEADGAIEPLPVTTELETP
jgi:ribosomal protein S27AE